MAIPGYDSGSVAERTHESVGARVAIVAGVVPDGFRLERSGRDPPVDALGDPVDVVGLEASKAVEAVRLTLVYDPSRLPPGASPTDVTVAVQTGNGWDPLESTVDLDETTVTAVLNDSPSGETIVAGYDDRDQGRNRDQGRDAAGPTE
ncbi:hypothetical protein [Halobiforma nitratireducens]|uniref:Uncharacterized protein n=1 Tax=Halobiforma nitratireducens JCM 10879 TaxID=1227454 RepID=M0M578_9EURY|nr:hypothetical protein [Halobiforma nitratireducens]EMA40866.1 hypothetical protein C446_06805 [Halobiforma nitratireducens JCM 10879]